MFDFDESLTYSVPVGGTYGNGIDTLTGRPIVLSTSTYTTVLNWEDTGTTSTINWDATFPRYHTYWDLFADLCGVGEDCDEPMEETDELINYLNEIHITNDGNEGNGK